MIEDVPKDENTTGTNKANSLDATPSDIIDSVPGFVPKTPLEVPQQEVIDSVPEFAPKTPIVATPQEVIDAVPGPLPVPASYPAVAPGAAEISASAVALGLPPTMPVIESAKLGPDQVVQQAANISTERLNPQQ